MAPAQKINYKDKIENGELDFSMTELSKIPVKDLAPLKKAVKIDFSNNLIVTIPNQISTLNHLVQLDLSNNLIKELPESFGALVKLKHLNLCNNQLTYLPLSFCELKALRWLDVKNNPLIPELAQIAGECSNALQCQQCARSIVNFLSQMQKVVQEEALAKQEQEAIEEPTNVKQEEKQQKQKQKPKQKQKQEKQVTKNETKEIKSNKKTKNVIEKHNNYVKTFENSNNDKTKSKKRKASKKNSSSLFFNIFKMILKIGLMSMIPLVAFYAVKKDPKKYEFVQQQMLHYYNNTVNALPPVVLNYFQMTRDFCKPVIDSGIVILSNVYERIWSALPSDVMNYIQIIRDFCQHLIEFGVVILSNFYERIESFALSIVEMIQTK